MDTKKIIAILKNIVSNKREVERGEQLELSFKVEPTDSNRAIFKPEEMRTYTVEEVAQMISRIDINELGNDIDFIESLWRKLKNDNVNEDTYKNEEPLVVPLEQLIEEYKGVIKDEELESNQVSLDKIKTDNDYLSNNVKLVSVGEGRTDSKSHLEYLAITNDEGRVELIQLTDPDYLARFKNEYASRINNMTPTEFANTLKFSTESALDSVKLDTYLTDEEVRNKMRQPLIKDNNVLSYEFDEVKRQAQQFMANEDIYISIDKYGEIFYTVGDGVMKGYTEDGVRRVEFIQPPSRYISNEKTIVPEEKPTIGSNQDEPKSVEDPIDKVVGNMDVQVTFDKNEFLKLFENRKTILESNDKDRQNKLISQLNALFDLGYTQNIEPELVQCVRTYYLENKDRLESAKHSESVVNDSNMSLQEFNLLTKLDEFFNLYYNNVREEAIEEINEFGIEGETKEQVQENVKVRTLQKPMNRRQAAFSTITIVLEILTVAIIIMMFLSLDI